MKKFAMLFLASAALLSATAGAMEEEKDKKKIVKIEASNPFADMKSQSTTQYVIQKPVQVVSYDEVLVAKSKELKVVDIEQVKSSLKTEIEKTVLADLESKKNTAREEGRQEIRDSLSIIQRNPKKSIFYTALGTGATVASAIIFGPLLLKWLEENGETVE